MPIEIRELVIKTTVNNNNENTSAASSDQGGNSEAMVNEIVDRVFRIIQQKSER